MTDSPTRELDPHADCIHPRRLFHLYVHLEQIFQRWILARFDTAILRVCRYVSLLRGKTHPWCEQYLLVPGSPDFHLVPGIFEHGSVDRWSALRRIYLDIGIFYDRLCSKC